MAVEARVIDRNGQQVVVFPDGTEVPLARVQAAMAQRPAATGPATPPRADAPMSVSAGPSYSFGDVGRGVGNEELSAAYGSLSNAMQPDAYDPLSVAKNYVNNMGQAGLLGVIGGAKKIGGYAADVIGAGQEMLGEDRWVKGGAANALYGDMGAGIQAAGVGPEARMLDALASAGAGRSAVDAARREALQFAADESGALRLTRGGYIGSHSAPEIDVGATLDNPRMMFGGDDIYTSNALQYFGTGNPSMDRESLSLIQRMRDKPNRMVDVYRAVPKDAKNEIGAGDWVTTSRKYATEHGESSLGGKGNYKIVKETVNASELATDGNSIHEWGWWPSQKRISQSLKYDKMGKDKRMAVEDYARSIGMSEIPQRESNAGLLGAALQNRDRQEM